ncbi:UDP-glycosyltransferase 73C4 [Apostasia shenzhenica]|uniref:Glycosyltransferase n=1 Tax=Apostasia shenzhenica TaxID=1088818 RepID=A0A2I0B9R9_9ASPA|nr:UDP-glycosyltransferase 73C4 [Apostasia shenzhenica]
MTIELPAINGFNRPHFVLIPLMAAGHTIPMIDMACLLAGHGAAVTLITTPLNAARVKATADSIHMSGDPINIVALTFPAAEFGLPEGCENLDAVPTLDLIPNFFHACAALREPLVVHLRQVPTSPSCIIADSFHPWAHDLAVEFGVPRFMFNGFCSFSLLCRYVIYHEKILERIKEDEEQFIIPGLLHRVEISKDQCPKSIGGTVMVDFRDKMMAAEALADGVVINSFDELEPEYVAAFGKATGKTVMTIGPMLLCNEEDAAKTGRGNQSAIDEERCLSWLDGRRPGSVVYVSFGSLAKTPPEQVMEIGLGLEASNQAFVWVIKAGERSPEVEEWIERERFEERTKERGLLIRGWAPQRLILGHPAVGGFVTHCGWNSTLEGVTAGVPMATWPHFAEQFLNERLVVEILKIGVSVGVKKATMFVKDGRKDGAEPAAVRREEVERAVRRLMEEDGEGKEVRERARVMGEKARKAMKEGGSSHLNLNRLVRFARERERAQ